MSFDDDVAPTYRDRQRGDELAAVSFLEQIAGPGPALELGIGTGRLALPLAARGIRVDGVELSPSMLAQLRTRTGGDAIAVTVGKLADVPVAGTYRLVFVAWNTLFAGSPSTPPAACTCRSTDAEPGSMRRFGLLVVLGAGLVGSPSTPARAAEAPVEAEDGLRWWVRDGGPATAEAALAAMGLAPDGGKKTAFLVQYYELAPPAAAPPGSQAILRLRTETTLKGKPYRLRLKYRTEEPVGPVACPWDPAEKAAAEADVGFMAAGEREVFSYSCDRDSKVRPEPPPDLGATLLPCSCTMDRLEVGKTRAERTRVETWLLTEGTLLEVSRRGDRTAEARDAFRRKVVAPLLAAGARPVSSSKTEACSTCLLPRPSPTP